MQEIFKNSTVHSIRTYFRMSMSIDVLIRTHTLRVLVLVVHLLTSTEYMLKIYCTLKHLLLNYPKTKQIEFK